MDFSAYLLSAVIPNLHSTTRPLCVVSLRKMLFLTPIPFLMLVWINADKILWYHAGFALPSIAFATVVMPGWCTQRYGMACHRVRVIQWYVVRTRHLVIRKQGRRVRKDLCLPEIVLMGRKSSRCIREWAARVGCLSVLTKKRRRWTKSHDIVLSFSADLAPYTFYYYNNPHIFSWSGRPRLRIGR